MGIPTEADPIATSADGARDGDESAGQSAPTCGHLPLDQRVEAVLLASDRPLGESRLVEILDLIGVAKPLKRRRPPETRAPKAADDVPPDGEPARDDLDDPVAAKARKCAVQDVRRAIERLNGSYAETSRTFRIAAVAGGWQIMTLPQFGPLLVRLRGERLQTRLSQAALESLSIIAYRQPILRADLESIRGVACGEILKSLMDRRLVRIVGRAEEVGRPMLYGTTKEFLRVFGIASLDDLPRSGAPNDALA